MNDLIKRFTLLLWIIPLAFIAASALAYLFISSQHIDIKAMEEAEISVPFYYYFLYAENTPLWHIVLSALLIGLAGAGIVSCIIYVVYYIKEKGFGSNTLWVILICLAFSTVLCVVLAFAVVPYYIYVIKRYRKVVKFKGMGDIW